jgi:hypothetical protein
VELRVIPVLDGTLDSPQLFETGHPCPVDAALT